MKKIYTEKSEVEVVKISKIRRARQRNSVIGDDCSIFIYLFIYLSILFLADLLTDICFCYLYVQIHRQHYSNKKKRRNIVPEINSNLNRMQLALSVEKPRKYV